MYRDIIGQKKMLKKSYRVKYRVYFTVFIPVLRYQLTFYRKCVMDRNY